MARSGDRHHFLDALRGAAMILGVVYHVGIASGQRTAPVELGLWGLNGFRMALFFAVAGFFAQMLYRRRGAASFVHQRLTRIGVPFAVGTLLLVPLVMRPSTLAGGAIPLLGVHPVLVEIWRGETSLVAGLGSVDLQHLWFLQYLLFFYAVTLVSVPALRALLPSPTARLARAGAALLASRWKALWLALPTAPLLAATGSIAVVDESDHLLPPLGYLAYYGFFYGAGWLLFGVRERIPELVRGWRAHCLAAAGILAILPPLHPWSPVHVSHPAAQLASLLLSALFSWLAILGSAGAFYTYLNRGRPVLRYVADASYWIYLVHLSLVAIFTRVAVQSSIPVALQPVFTFTVVLGIGFATYAVFVRHTAIGAVLNGRIEPASRAAAPAPEGSRPRWPALVESTG